MSSRPDPPSSSKPIKDALQPIIIPQAPSALSTFGQAIVAPFTHHRGDSSTKIFSERMQISQIVPSSPAYFFSNFLVAPHIMTPRMVHHATTRSRRGEPSGITSKYDFSTIGRAPLHLGLGRRVTSRDLQIEESAPDLLNADVPEPEGIAQDVSLFQGFQATIPSSERNKTRRRRMRNVQFEGGEELGTKEIGSRGKGTSDERHYRLWRKRGQEKEQEDHEGAAECVKDTGQRGAKSTEEGNFAGQGEFARSTSMFSIPTP
jgi:division protein 1